MHLCSIPAALRRMPRRPSGPAALLLCALLLCACGGQAPAGGLQTHGELARPAVHGAPAGLPAPAGLVPSGRPRSASYFESDLYRDGKNFDAALPAGKVAANGSLCDFSPAYGGGPLKDAAFCVYQFTVGGYDRNPVIGQSWSVPPAQGDEWLALSNWNSNRWDWFQANPAQYLSVPSLSPYLRADGTLLAAVVCLGSAPATLDWLRLGSRPPAVQLSVNPSDGLVPYEAVFDASGTTDPDGTIAKYEWDLDGDGSYELDTGTSAFVGDPVNVPGTIHTHLRVTDNDGVSVVWQTPLRGYSQWQHTWGGSQADALAACAYDGDNAVYFTGLTGSFGAGNTDLLLLKYDLAGNLMWARTWGSAAHDEGNAVAIDSEGNVVVAGSSTQGGGGVITVKFTPAGEVLWSQSFSYDVYYPFVTSVATWGTDIYIGGYLKDFSKPTQDLAMLASYTGAGAARWLKAYADDAHINSVRLFAPFFGSPKIYATGKYDQYLLYLVANTDGSLALDKTWGTVLDNDEGMDLSVTGLISPSIWITAQQLPSGTAIVDSLLLNYNGGAASQSSTIWSGGHYDEVRSLLAATGGFFLSGDTDSFNSNGDGMLVGFNGSAVLELGTRLNSGSAATHLSGMAQAFNGDAYFGCGTAGSSSGLSWKNALGSASGQTNDWQAGAGTWETLAMVSTAGLGADGNAQGAVKDSGGGDTDALAVMRVLPAL